MRGLYESLISRCVTSHDSCHKIGCAVTISWNVLYPFYLHDLLHSGVTIYAHCLRLVIPHISMHPTSSRELHGTNPISGPLHCVDQGTITLYQEAPVRGSTASLAGMAPRNDKVVYDMQAKSAVAKGHYTHMKNPAGRGRNTKGRRISEEEGGEKTAPFEASKPQGLHP